MIIYTKETLLTGSIIQHPFGVIYDKFRNPYYGIPFLVVRKASFQEYVDYCRQEKTSFTPFDPTQFNFYKISID